MQTYNLIKQVMWNCIIEDKNGKMVSLRMVIGLLADIETKIELANNEGDHAEADVKTKPKFEADLSYGTQSKVKTQLSRFGYI